jgi:hypothetical protein
MRHACVHNDEMNTMTHSRVTPQGQLMGRIASRMAELGQARLVALGLDGVQAPMMRAEMCKSCACQPGSVPNGCLQTQLDFLKSVHEGKPFRCHAPMDGKICTGWTRARAEMVDRPLPPQIVELLDKWEYSPPDEPES